MHEEIIDRSHQGMKTPFRLAVDAGHDELADEFAKLAAHYRPDGMPDWKPESRKRKENMTEVQARMQKIENEEVCCSRVL